MEVQHSDYLGAHRRRDAATIKPFIKIVLPGSLLWLLFFVGLLALAPPLVLYIPGMLVIVLGVIVGGMVHAQRVTKSELGGVTLACTVCDEPVPELEWASHLGVAHPAYAQYLQIARLSLLAYVVPALLTVFILYIVFSPLMGSDAVALPWILTVVGLLIWVAFLEFWAYGVGIPYLNRQRAEWRDKKEARNAER